MTHILRTSTEHKTASLADERTYRPMEINIERSPQHWWPSEGSNLELFAHENDILTARPQLHHLNTGAEYLVQTSLLNHVFKNKTTPKA